MLVAHLQTRNDGNFITGYKIESRLTGSLLMRQSQYMKVKHISQVDHW